MSPVHNNEKLQPRSSLDQNGCRREHTLAHNYTTFKEQPAKGNACSCGRRAEAHFPWLQDLMHAVGINRRNIYYEDCLQEARLALLSLPGGNNESYQRQAAKWAAWNYMKLELRESPAAVSATAVTTVTPEDIVVEQLTCEDNFRRLLQEMPREELYAYILCVYSPLTRQQIADIMGMNTRTLRRIMRQADRSMEKFQKLQSDTRKPPPQKQQKHPGRPLRVL